MEENTLREQLADLLIKGNAHMPFYEAVADFPLEHINTVPQNVGYSFWFLVEHIRMTQWDIIDFIVNPKYKEREWPKEYWPKKGEEATKDMWEKSVKKTIKDIQTMVDIVRDPETNLFTKIPNGEGQNILREALVVSDHNAYHVGEFAILRQVVGIWPKNHS